MPATRSRQMPQQRPELADDASFQTEFSSRLARIDERHSAEVTEAEQALTRAHNARAKARAAAEAEHAAAKLERHAEVVVRGTIPLFRRGLRALSTNHSVGILQTIVDNFQSEEVIHRRVLGQEIDSRVIGTAAVAEYLEKHPEALGRLANPDNWFALFESGIGSAAYRATYALRQGFDIRAVENALLDLDATIKRIALSPGYSALAPDDAKEIWTNITSLCLPGDLDTERRQQHAARVKARGIAAHVAEQELQYRAVTGDKSAREEIAARGGNALEVLMRGAAHVLTFATGRRPLAQELNAVTEGRT